MRPKKNGAEVCQNEYIKAMLVPYAERSLAKANRAEVEAHLTECQFCREEVRRLHDLMRPLSELAKSGFKPVYDAHPTHEQLFRYSVNDRQQSQEEQRNIRLHIFMCNDCSKEIQLIKQVEHDFEGISATDSSRWTIPPVLRNLLVSPSRTSVIVENALEEHIPNIERLRALMQKINLHLVGVVAAVILLMFICLSFITCGSGDDEPQAKVSPSPSASATVAQEVVPEEWVALPLGDFSPVKACTVLSSQNIAYRSSRGRLEVKSVDLEKAQVAVSKYSQGDNPPETTLALEDSSESSNYAQEQASTSEDSSGFTSEEPPTDSSYNSAAVEEQPAASTSRTLADNSPAAPPSSPSVSPAAQAAPAAVSPSVKTFSQPRVAVPARRAVVRPVYSAQPKVKAKVASRPRRAYDTAAYQPAPSPTSKVVPKNHPGDGPTPISASYIAGSNHPESTPRSSVAPSPAIIRPGSDVTVSSMRRHTPKTEYTAEATAVAEEPTPQNGNIVGGNTYDEADNVTNRDTIE